MTREYDHRRRGISHSESSPEGHNEKKIRSNINLIAKAKFFIA